MENEPISRENFARVAGIASAVSGVGILLAVWLSASYFSSAVTTCNTVVADLYNRSNPESGAKCAVANFAVDFRWVFIALGVLTLIGGIFRFVTADPEIRSRLGLDEDN